ncbi:MAG: T9SS type A sorting domain-containing protein, partial [Bacteroidetes bacterium]|nr:T9SS type A sorting domain-containing protein [Bacteroidota bacterium]
LELAEGVELYPNPTQGIVHLKPAHAGILALYNLQGQKLAQYPIEKGIQTLQLPNILAAGIYYGRFVGVNGTSESIKINYEP